MSNNYFFPQKSCRLWDNVEKYCTAGQATGDSMAHAHCMLDTQGYRHTLRICNTYSFSTATMVSYANARQCYVCTYTARLVSERNGQRINYYWTYKDCKLFCEEFFTSINVRTLTMKTWLTCWNTLTLWSDCLSLINNDHKFETDFSYRRL